MTEREAEIKCSRFIRNWKSLYHAKNYTACKEEINAFIREFKPVYKLREDGFSVEMYTYLYVFLILAKGFEDYTILAELTRDKKWPQNNEQTELIWDKLWDAKEKFGYFNDHYLENGLFSEYTDLLDRLECFFYDAFGKGVYASPELLVRKANCSICGMDIKGCNHIPGYIYEGYPCYEIARDVQFLNVCMVESPHDMRCRLWSWRINQETREVDMRFMNTARIDDFLKE